MPAPKSGRGLLPGGGGTPLRSIDRQQEVAGRDLAVLVTRTRDKADVNALEARVGEQRRRLVPRIVSGDLRAAQGDLAAVGDVGRGARAVDGGDVALEDARRVDAAEADGAVPDGGVLLEEELARLGVVGEAVGLVAEGDAVDDVAPGGEDVTCAAAAELEAVAVAGEVGEVLDEMVSSGVQEVME